MSTVLSKDRLLHLFTAYDQSVQNYRSKKKVKITASKRREIYEITKEQLFFQVPQVVLQRIDESIQATVIADKYKIDDDRQDCLLNLVKNFKKFLELTGEHTCLSQISTLYQRYCYKDGNINVYEDLLEPINHLAHGLKKKQVLPLRHEVSLDLEGNVKPVNHIRINSINSGKKEVFQENIDDTLLIEERKQRFRSTITTCTKCHKSEKGGKFKSAVRKSPVKKNVLTTKPKLRTRRNIVKIERVLGKSLLSEVKIIIPSALQNELTKKKLKMSVDLNNAYLTTNENVQECNGTCKCCKTTKSKTKKSQLVSYIENFPHNVDIEEMTHSNIELSQNVISTTTADIHSLEETEKGSETATAISTVLSTNDRGEWILSAPNATDNCSQVITFSHEQVNCEMPSSLCLPSSCNSGTIDDDFMIPLDIENSAYDLVDFIEGRATNQVTNTIKSVNSQQNINIISCEVFPTETYEGNNKYKNPSNPLGCGSTSKQKNSLENNFNFNKEHSFNGRNDNIEDDGCKEEEGMKSICKSDEYKEEGEKSTTSVLPDMPDLIGFDFEIEGNINSGKTSTKPSDIMPYYTTNNISEATASNSNKLNSELQNLQSPVSASNDFDDDALSINAPSLEGCFSPSNADERFEILSTSSEELFEVNEDKKCQSLNIPEGNQSSSFECELKQDTPIVEDILNEEQIESIAITQLRRKQDVLQEHYQPSKKPFKIPKLNSNTSDINLSLNRNHTTVLRQVDNYSGNAFSMGPINEEDKKKLNRFNSLTHTDGMNNNTIRRQVIQNVYDNPCFKFLQDSCNDKKCRYRHGLLSSRIIKKRLLDMSSISKIVALKFILRHSKLFHLYFTTFCEIFTETKDKKHLLEMADFCVLFKNSEIYLKEIFTGFKKIGFTPVESIKLILQRLQHIDYSSGCISVIIDLIIQSDINEFLPLLHKLLEMDNCKRTDEIIKLANICIQKNHPELSQLILKVIFQIPYETLKEDRCKSILTFLNVIRNGNSTESLQNYLTNVECQFTN